MTDCPECEGVGHVTVPTPRGRKLLGSCRTCTRLKLIASKLYSVPTDLLAAELERRGLGVIYSAREEEGWDWHEEEDEEYRRAVEESLAEDEG